MRADRAELQQKQYIKKTGRRFKQNKRVWQQDGRLMMQICRRAIGQVGADDENS